MVLFVAFGLISHDGVFQRKLGVSPRAIPVELMETEVQ
jgi:hypothetical protein